MFSQSFRLSLFLGIVIVSVSLSVPAFAGPGGSEVGNGRSRPARSAPRSDIPQSDQPKQDENEKGGQKSGEPKEEVAVKLMSVELSGVDLAAGDTLNVRARVSASAVQGCAGKLLALEMINGSKSFDSCQATKVDNGVFELLLTHKFETVLADRTFSMDAISVELSGRLVELSLRDTFVVSVKAAAAEAALAVRTSRLETQTESSSAKYGELFELVLSVESKAELTELTLLMQSQYGDEDIVSETLTLKAEGYFTQVREADGLVTVRIPMYVPATSTAAKTIQFMSAYVKNAGYQDLQTELTDRPAIRLTR